MNHLQYEFLRRRFVGVTAVLVALIVGLVALAAVPGQTAVAAPAQQIPPVISFSTANYSVEEGQTTDILVTISAQPTAVLTATVEFLTQDGTARAGVNYVTTSGVITFTSTSPLTSGFTVQTIRDNIPTDNRTVILTLRNPVNATTNISSAQLTIRNVDTTPTATATGGLPIFADALEPNNTFAQASETASGATALCNLTFYPPGDEDYFRWWGKAGINYTVQTNNLNPAIDTVLVVFNINQQQIAENDDVEPGNFRSQTTFTANADGFYYARVSNKSPGDPVDKRYCFQITQTVSPTPTPPTAVPGGADDCEFNSTAETACPIAVGETLNLSFVPTFGSTQDTDYFRLWVQQGIYYTCDTEVPAGSLADTNMILKDLNNNDFSPQIGNDDKEPGNLGSRVSFASFYKGWLFIIVGPVNVPSLEESPLHTYTLTCLQTIATATPTPTETPVPQPVVTSPPSTISTPTPNPTVDPLLTLATPTPIDIQSLLPTAVPPPVVNVQPLPTATAFASGAQTIMVDVTVYFDMNNNFQPELNEGIMDMAVALYDNATGELISFGHTNEAGIIRFQVESAGTVRIVVPFLNYSQIVTANQEEVLLRVAPGTLPIGIP
jgi:hypothetical protein